LTEPYKTIKIRKDGTSLPYTYTHKVKETKMHVEKEKLENDWGCFILVLSRLFSRAAWSYFMNYIAFFPTGNAPKTAILTTKPKIREILDWKKA